MRVFPYGPEFERQERAGRQNLPMYRAAQRQSRPTPAPEAGHGAAASTRQPQNKPSAIRRMQTSPAPWPRQTTTAAAERPAGRVPAETTDERPGAAIRQPAPAKLWQ